MLNNWIYLLVAFASVLVAYGCLSLLNRQQLLDIPNERSSHTIPVPRGGGISFAALYLLILAALSVEGFVAIADALVLLLGGTLLATVGYIDDRFGLSSKLRLLLQCCCVVISITCFYVGSIDLVNFADWIWLGLLVIASVWWINLFNFLDGIDGYAASEAVFISVVGAGLCLRAEADIEAQLFLLLALSMVGFVIVNWSPARMFMGDVGSYFLGFIIAMLAVLTVREQLISPLCWLVLTALFWIDASYTLVYRILNGECWYQAHRSHAYQILSRRWGSHRRVTILSILVNIGWLLPLTFSCQWLLDEGQITAAVLVTVLACAPIIWGVFKVKSVSISS